MSLMSLEARRLGGMTPKAFTSRVKLQRILSFANVEASSTDEVHTDGASALAIDYIEEKFLICCTKKGHISLYNLGVLSHQDFSVRIDHIRPIYDPVDAIIRKVQWHPFDISFFTLATGKNLYVWDTTAVQVVDTFRLEHEVMSYDVSKIARGSGLIATAMTNADILLLDATTGSEIHKLKGHEVGVESVAWSPMEEHMLASGGTDKRILLWDVRSPQKFLKCLDQHNLSGNEIFGIQQNLPTAHNSPVRCLKFTDNGLYLLSRSADSQVLLWDVAFAKNTLVNYGIPVRKNTRNLQFTFDIFNDSGTPLIFIPFHCHIFICDLHTGIKYKTLKGHSRFVNCCVYRPCCQHLYSSANDMNVIRWAPLSKQNHKGLQQYDL